MVEAGANFSLWEGLSEDLVLQNHLVLSFTLVNGIRSAVVMDDDIVLAHSDRLVSRGADLVVGPLLFHVAQHSSAARAITAELKAPASESLALSADFTRKGDLNEVNLLQHYPKSLPQ